MTPKQELRAKFRSELKKLPPDRFRIEGKRAAEHIKTSSPWQNARQVLIFLSLPDEIDTAPLLDLAFTQGKEVFAPKICADSLDFYQISSPKSPGTFDPLKTGPYGIREPDSSAPKFAANSAGNSGASALIITPGLAFDRQGRRLGRGRGYYDRFFASLDRAAYYALGLCLESQLLPEVPADNLDKSVDAICTGRELFAILT